MADELNTGHSRRFTTSTVFHLRLINASRSCQTLLFIAFPRCVDCWSVTLLTSLNLEVRESEVQKKKDFTGLEFGSSLQQLLNIQAFRLNQELEHTRVILTGFGCFHGSAPRLLDLHSVCLSLVLFFLPLCDSPSADGRGSVG